HPDVERPSTLHSHLTRRCLPPHEPAHAALGTLSLHDALPISVTLTMLRAIRDYREMTGHVVGFKPAGGISTAKDALAYLVLVKEDRKSTRLNSSHVKNSYAVFCLEKKN